MAKTCFCKVFANLHLSSKFTTLRSIHSLGPGAQCRSGCIRRSS